MMCDDDGLLPLRSHGSKILEEEAKSLDACGIPDVIIK
jgi:hypothetical protein